MKKFILSIFLFVILSSFNSDKSINQLKQNVSRNLPEFYGWCSQEKAINFIDLVLEVKPKVCVEIGVFGGASLFPVASTLKFLDQGVVYGIDPWDNAENLRQFDPADTTNINWWKKVNFNSIYTSFRKLFKKYGLDDYVITLIMPSQSATGAIKDIDILYIDGCHSEHGFIIDVLLYLPKVRSGGYIWMNDTLWEQSQEAIGLLLLQCEVVKLIDNGNCILFKKR